MCKLNYISTYFVIISFVFIALVKCNSNDVDYEGSLNIQLEHSLSSFHEPDFVKRGNISILQGVSTVSNLPLTLDDRKKIQELGKEDKFYRLRATVINNDGSEIQFLTSVKACILADSYLNDYFSISLDHANNVIGISLGAQTMNSCQGSDMPIERLTKFNTKVYVVPITVGPIPDTASYIQKLEREREAKERGDVKDNRSFLAKYWMYIVPVVIIMVLSSAANPDGSGGARQG